MRKPAHWWCSESLNDSGFMESLNGCKAPINTFQLLTARKSLRQDLASEIIYLYQHWHEYFFNTQIFPSCVKIIYKWPNCQSFRHISLYFILLISHIFHIILCLKWKFHTDWVKFPQGKIDQTIPNIWNKKNNCQKLWIFSKIHE